jgi:hypothetical protein
MEKFAVNKDIKKAKRWVNCGSDKVISRKIKKAHRKAYQKMANDVRGIINGIDPVWELDIMDLYDSKYNAPDPLDYTDEDGYFDHESWDCGIGWNTIEASDEIYEALENISPKLVRLTARDLS